MHLILIIDSAKRLRNIFCSEVKCHKHTLSICQDKNLFFTNLILALNAILLC